MRIAILISVLALILYIRPPAASGQEDELTEARQAWTTGNYNKCLNIFRFMLNDNPDNTEAQYYVAGSLYYTGRKAEGIRLYEKLAREFPDDRYAKMAQDLLPKLKQSAASSSISTQQTNAPTHQSSGTTKATRIGQILDRMIQTVKPAAGGAPVSLICLQRTRTILSHVPLSVLETLDSKKMKIYVTPTLIDKFPELKNREGRGYDGYTYKSCPGMFSGGHLILCESVYDEDKDDALHPVDPQYYETTVLHELGHAIDWYYGDISANPNFKHAYNLDTAQISPETKQQIKYFLQKSSAGNQEACAELIGVILGAYSHEGLVRASFPLTLKFLNNQLHL